MYGCHGQSLVMHGVPLASAWSATGLTVSGVEAAVTMSTLSLLMRSPVTCAARLESDWLSLVTIVTGCFMPSPQTMPSPMASVARSTQYLSGTPNDARPPVCGVTKPILTSRPVSAPALTVVVVSPAMSWSWSSPAAAVVVVAGAAVVVVGAAAAGRQQAAEAAGYADRRAGDAGHFQEVAAADTRLQLPFILF